MKNKKTVVEKLDDYTAKKQAEIDAMDPKKLKRNKRLIRASWITIGAVALLVVIGIVSNGAGNDNPTPAKAKSSSSAADTTASMNKAKQARAKFDAEMKADNISKTELEQTRIYGMNFCTDASTNGFAKTYKSYAVDMTAEGSDALFPALAKDTVKAAADAWCPQFKDDITSKH